MPDRDLSSLPPRLESLIQQYHQIELENKRLRAERATWEAERTRLLEQNNRLSQKLERFGKDHS